KPLDRKTFGPEKWKFVFLQHGVTQNDLSHWINKKRVDLVIAASAAEEEAFVADGSPYRLTELDVGLTGFRRHDRLQNLRDGAAGGRRSLLIMPTWRADLLGPATGMGNLRALRAEFWESDYAQAWFGLLRSEALRQVAESHQLDIVFLPHPNLAPH